MDTCSEGSLEPRTPTQNVYGISVLCSGRATIVTIGNRGKSSRSNLRVAKHVATKNMVTLLEVSGSAGSRGTAFFADGLMHF